MYWSGSLSSRVRTLSALALGVGALASVSGGCSGTNANTPTARASARTTALDAPTSTSGAPAVTPIRTATATPFVPTPIAARPGVTVQPPIPLSDAKALIQAYLDAWRDEGGAVASSRYTIDLQGPHPTPDPAAYPKLLSGRVVSSRVYCVWGPNKFMLLVSMELHFPNGDGFVWGEGSNDRFFEFVRTNASQPFRFQISSGPDVCQ